MRKLSVYNALWLVFMVAFSGFALLEARRERETGFFWVAMAAICLVIGLLLGVDFYLQKRKSPEWMSMYHVSLLIVFGVAVVGLFVFLLRYLH